MWSPCFTGPTILIFFSSMQSPMFLTALRSVQLPMLERGMWTQSLTLQRREVSAQPWYRSLWNIQHNQLWYRLQFQFAQQFLLALLSGLASFCSPVCIQYSPALPLLCIILNAKIDEQKQGRPGNKVSFCNFWLAYYAGGKYFMPIYLCLPRTVTPGFYISVTRVTASACITSILSLLIMIT